MTKNKNCAGTYPVSGYTRSDGTEVSSYMRTCGAKHFDDLEYSKGNYDGISGAAANILENSKVKHKLKQANSMLQNTLYQISLAKVQADVASLDLIDKPYYKYYQLSLNYDYKKQFNKDNAYTKFSKIDSEQMKDFIKNSFKDEISNDTDIVIPQYGTKLHQEVINSPEIKEVLNDNLTKIKKGEYVNKHLDIEFVSSDNLYLVLHNAKLYNVSVVDDYICGTLIDYYDFTKNSYKYYVYKSIVTAIANNNAYFQQETGHLRNYLLIMPVRISL